jgi:hypothetical protein
VGTLAACSEERAEEIRSKKGRKRHVVVALGINVISARIGNQRRAASMLRVRVRGYFG